MHDRTLVDNVKLDASFWSNAVMTLSKYMATKHASMGDICFQRVARLPDMMNSKVLVNMVLGMIQKCISIGGPYYR